MKQLSRGGSWVGGGGHPPPPPRTWGFLTQLVFCFKICLRHQSFTSFVSGAPLAKKNPGSAPAQDFSWFYFSSSIFLCKQLGRNPWPQSLHDRPFPSGCGGMSGQVVNISNSRSGGPGFKPCPLHCFLGQGTFFHFVSLFTQVYKWVLVTYRYCLGVTL